MLIIPYLKRLGPDVLQIFLTFRFGNLYTDCKSWVAPAKPKLYETLRGESTGPVLGSMAAPSSEPWLWVENIKWKTPQINNA